MMDRQVIILCLCIFLGSAYGKETLVFSSTLKNDRARLVCSEVLGKALDRLDIEMNIYQMPEARSLKMSSQGGTDGDVARIGGLESKYSDLYQVAVSCFSHDVYLYVKAGKEFKVNGWGSIPKGYLIGYQKGVQFIEIAAQEYNLALYPLANAKQVLGLMKKGRIDLLVGTEQFLTLTDSTSRTTGIIMLVPAIEHHSFYSYLHKKHQYILPKLNNILISMQASGEVELIQQKHMMPR